MDYEKLARDIYTLIGPSDNITQVYHCMTRLRLHVKEEHFTKEQLTAIPGVLGVNKSGDEWQIVVGPGKAGHVTAAFKTLLTQPATSASSPASSSVTTLAKQAGVGDGKALHDAIRQKNATPVKLALKKIAQIFTPIIPAFIACGLITGILNIIIKVDPSLASLPFVQMLAVAGNAVFFGLNIFVGINSAKLFGGSPMLGGVMAAVISHPMLTQIMLWDTPLIPGRGGIIAVVLVVFFSSYIEKKLHHLVPAMLDLFITPLVTVLLSTFVALCVFQPIAGIISEAIGMAATTSITAGGAITGFVLGGTFLPMVMCGVHQGLTPIHAELLSQYGVNILLPILAMAGGGQVGASLAVYVKTKNKTLRKTIASALPVGIMGIGEPLIYGVTLPLGKPFIGACIGGAAGGAVQAAYMVGSTSMGISGLPLTLSTNHMLLYLAGLFTSYIVGFIITWLVGFEDPAC